MTLWLEYFSEGLAIQMTEVKERGEKIIKLDLLAKEFKLSDRQESALEYLYDNKEISIQAYQNMFPKVNRRTLQRDLKIMLEKGLLKSEGSTNNLVYRFFKNL